MIWFCGSGKVGFGSAVESVRSPLEVCCGSKEDPLGLMGVCLWGVSIWEYDTVK